MTQKNLMLEADQSQEIISGELVVISEVGTLSSALSPFASHFGIQVLPLDPSLVLEESDLRPVIIDVDLCNLGKYDRLESILRRHRGPRLAILKTHNRPAILRAHDLGVADFHFVPLDEAKVCSELRALLNSSAEMSWQFLTPTQRLALRVSLKCFEDCMGAGAAGRPLPGQAVKESISNVLAATADLTLNEWMASLRRHHNYSFRHSMMVCGTTSIFAQSIGIGGSDLETLTTAGLLHDIGKAKIPPSLLENWQPQSDADTEIINLHPTHAREVLQHCADLPEPVVDVAIHHHEKIDGSGFPMGLSGSAINDHVRIVSICDVYNNLVDPAHSKPALEKEAAIDLMIKPERGLDPQLVRCFGDFILQSA